MSAEPVPGGGSAGRLLTRVLLAVALGACAGVRPDTGEPPPVPGQPIMAWADDLVIRMRNDGDEVLHVTAVRLSDCTNIREHCGEYSLDIVLEPGEMRVLLRLTKQRAEYASHFDWDYDATFF